MIERIPQSVAKRVVFKTFLAADHVTAGGEGLTVPVQVSKNGGDFANLATPANATHMNPHNCGWYYIDLAAADTDTLGPLIVRGTEGTIDPVEVVFQVVAATNAGFSALPDAAPGANGGLPTVDANNHVNGVTDTVTATLANGAHGGAAATLTLLSGVISNTGGVGLTINGSTKGMEISGSGGDGLTVTGAGANTYGIYVQGASKGVGMYGAAVGLDIAASAGNGITAVGTGGYDILADIKGDITGTLTTVTTLTNLPAITNNWITAAGITASALNGKGDWMTLGAGSESYTHTVYDTDGSTPLAGVSVWVSTDAAGTNVIAGIDVSDAAGQVTFALNPGTAYLWCQLPGKTFSNPTTITVTDV
jgi:hypothetical protein